MELFVILIGKQTEECGGVVGLRYGMGGGAFIVNKGTAHKKHCVHEQFPSLSTHTHTPEPRTR